MLLYVFTQGQAATVQTLDPGSDYQVVPRAISAASPGTGINANASATGYAAGDTVALIGNYVAPATITSNPGYVTNSPDIVAFMQALPCCDLVLSTIFAPPG